MNRRNANQLKKKVVGTDKSQNVRSQTNQGVMPTVVYFGQHDPMRIQEHLLNYNYSDQAATMMQVKPPQFIDSQRKLQAENQLYHQGALKTVPIFIFDKRNQDQFKQHLVDKGLDK